MSKTPNNAAPGVSNPGGPGAGASAQRRPRDPAQPTRPTVQIVRLQDDQAWRDSNIFPVISEGALRATLGILARTVAHR